MGNGDFSASTELDQDRTHNAVNETGTISGASGQTQWADPAHDAAGNMTTIPQPDDLTAGFAARYDAWNRLVELKEGATVVQTNAYDGLHRRVARTCGSDARHFYWNQEWHGCG